MAHERLFEVFAGAEPVALQDILDPAVETLDHAVGLRSHGRGQAVLDLELGAEAVEFVDPRCSALAQAEQPIHELCAIACREDALF